jgi:hypothetical protein
MTKKDAEKWLRNSQKYKDFLKSYVGLGYFIDPITGEKHDEQVLMDTTLEDSLEPNQCIGYKLTQKSKDLLGGGKVALVEIDESKSEVNEQGNMTPETAYRTGVVAWVIREVVDDMLDGHLGGQDMVYVDMGIIQALAKNVKKD